jgi:hypothetical protein
MQSPGLYQVGQLTGMLCGGGRGAGGEGGIPSEGKRRPTPTGAADELGELCIGPTGWGGCVGHHRRINLAIAVPPESVAAEGERARACVFVCVCVCVCVCARARACARAQSKMQPSCAATDSARGLSARCLPAVSGCGVIRFLHECGWGMDNRSS